MKFRDGVWLIREGYQAVHPREAYHVEATPDSLVIAAPTRPITDRGLLHDLTVLRVELAAVTDDVIRVRIVHFSGDKDAGPWFDLRKMTPGTASTAVEEDSATLTSGRLSARVDRRSWRVDFSAQGRPVTASGPSGMGYVVAPDGSTYVHEQLSLGVGELVYGLGERFTAFAKNGQAVEIWNRDGGTATEQSYKNVPFYLTNRGYGVFVNNPGRVSLEVASENVSRVQFSVPGETLEYFLIYGPTPKEVLEKYTALTGRPALPPAWSFGLWLSTSFTTRYDEQIVTDMVRGMQERGIPLSVFHFDSFWMKEFHWCNFKWDERAFPNPAAMLGRLRALGLRISLWLNPYVGQESELFEEARTRGYLIKKPNGGVWQTDQWQPGMGVVDFTNPEARQWFRRNLEKLVALGVDALKADFGERIPLDVTWHDGSDPERMHNYFTFLYNKLVYDTLHECRGEAVLFSRSATVGSQRFPVHWGGDCFSTFESMAESLRGGLSLGLCGFGFWSHDIGGFEGSPPADLYKRWIAFGLLSSHSRLHGSSSYRLPWLFDEEAVDVLRSFTKLKCRLMPYVFAAAVEAAERGVPVMRAMFLEFPEDPACDYLDRQFMLGPSILAAPVFSVDGRVDFYLPAGTWTSLLTGEQRHGPGWFRETHDFSSLPLFVRENTLLAMGAHDDRPDYDYATDVIVRLFAPADGAAITARVPTTTGAEACTFTARREGDTIEVSVTGKAPGWKVQLVGVEGVAGMEGCQAEPGPEGVLISPDQGRGAVRVRVG